MSSCCHREDKPGLGNTQLANRAAPYHIASSVGRHKPVPHSSENTPYLHVEVSAILYSERRRNCIAAQSVHWNIGKTHQRRKLIVPVSSSMRTIWLRTRHGHSYLPRPFALMASFFAFPLALRTIPLLVNARAATFVRSATTGVTVHFAVGVAHVAGLGRFNGAGAVAAGALSHGFGSVLDARARSVRLGCWGSLTEWRRQDNRRETEMIQQLANVEQERDAVV